MDRFSNVEDGILFGRLREIDGVLNPRGKSGWIKKEKEDIKQELRRRGYAL